MLIKSGLKSFTCFDQTAPYGKVLCKLLENKQDWINSWLSYQFFFWPSTVLRPEIVQSFLYHKISIYSIADSWCQMQIICVTHFLTVFTLLNIVHTMAPRCLKRVIIACRIFATHVKIAWNIHIQISSWYNARKKQLDEIRLEFWARKYDQCFIIFLENKIKQQRQIEESTTYMLCRESIS